MIYITIDEKNPEANAFLAYVKTLKFVKIKKVNETDAYNPKFVQKVLNSAKSKNRTTVNADYLWENI